MIICNLLIFYDIRKYEKVKKSDSKYTAFKND